VSNAETAAKQIREAMEDSPEAWVNTVESFCADSIKVRHDPPIADWGTTEEMEGGVNTERMFQVWRQEVAAQRRAALDYHLSHIDVGVTPEGGVYFANNHTGTMSDGHVVSVPVRVTTDAFENGKIVSWTISTSESVGELRDWLAAGNMEVPGT
jgi:hypothetical protein